MSEYIPPDDPRAKAINDMHRQRREREAAERAERDRYIREHTVSGSFADCPICGDTWDGRIEEPSYFTRDDVEVISSAEARALYDNDDPEMAKKFRSLAARIAALLPPEDSGTR
jgi:hypothetical protein